MKSSCGECLPVNDGWMADELATVKRRGTFVNGFIVGVLFGFVPAMVGNELIKRESIRYQGFAFHHGVVCGYRGAMTGYPEWKMHECVNANYPMSTNWNGGFR